MVFKNLLNYVNLTKLQDTKSIEKNQLQFPCNSNEHLENETKHIYHLLYHPG